MEKRSCGPQVSKLFRFWPLEIGVYGSVDLGNASILYSTFFDAMTYYLKLPMALLYA
jgi:hypothetical protein